MGLKTRRIGGLVIVMVALLLGGFWAGISYPRSSAEPRVVEGIVQQVSLGDHAFLLRPNGSATPDSYQLGSVAAWEAGGAWHEGGIPSCMSPLSHGQKIKMGVIDSQPSQGAPGGSIVAWVECSV